MKKLFLVAVAAMMLTGCGKEGYDWGSKEEMNNGNEFGQVTLALSEGNSVMVKSDPQTVTIDDEVELNSYAITATNNDTGAETKTIAAWNDKTFGDITDANKTVTIAAGTYKITAASCTVAESEADRGKPRFYGEKNVTVVAGSQTAADASVSCTLANAKVTVGYAASMDTYFTEYSVKISQTSSTNTIRTVTFDKNSSHYVLDTEGNPTTTINTVTDAFFTTPSTGTTIAVVVTAKKKDATVSTTYDSHDVSISAKSWYKITVGSTLTDQGQATLTLEVNGEVTVLEQEVNVNPYN